MIQKLKLIVAGLAVGLFSLTPAMVPVAVHAANSSASNIQQPLCDGAQNASNGQDGSCEDQSAGDGSGIKKIAKNIVNLVSIVVGAVSILMIIYGGFRYITSGGDSGRVGTAKNTLIYAVIGLIVVALAQLIVNFVLSTANNVTS